MASLPGFRFDITGASGSQGLLSPQNTWRAYILPRGGYASQDSTGTLITFDSTDVASRFAVNNWIQSGLSTANIRRVSAVGGNSLSVAGSALTVSENDHVFLIGNTEPVVSGGSATYTTPNTLVRQRNDDGATLFTNSMITSNSDGLIQGFAAASVYDYIIQDGNQANQGSIIGLEILSIKELRYAIDFRTGSSTNGIQEALDDLPSGGGKVVVGAGTFTNTATVILSNGQIVEGEGHTATIITIANSTNDDVFRTLNFSTLTGGNNWTTGVDGVIHGFGIIGLSIDGNKANQTSGYGIRIYGKRYIIRDVQIYDTEQSGLFSETGDVSGQTDQTDMPECQIGPLWIWSCGGDGIQYRGPHDGYISSAYISSCDEDGVSLEFSSGVYNGAVDIGFVHSYANRIGLVSGVNFNAEHLQVENNDQEGLIIQSGTGNCSIGMLKAFGNGVNPVDTVYEVELDGTFNLIGNCWVRVDTTLGAVSFDGVSNKVANARIDGNNTSATLLKVAANKTHFRGELYDADSSGGIGIVTGYTAQTQNCIIEAHINNCDTAWVNDNLGRRNIYTASIANVAGQTAIGGGQPLPDGNNDEIWNIVAFVGTTVTRSRNKGSVTLASGTTQAVVTHDLIATPGAEDIQISLNEDPGEVRWWLDGITGTTFNINTSGVTNTTTTFLWQAYI